MNRVEVATHDIAHMLCALPADTPNRQAVFTAALKSLIGFAISEHQLGAIRKVDNDLALVADIQARAARACVPLVSGG